ncbi:MAG: phenylpyruvate tautomerase MIF-related protein [Alphaproteobacteria bacterium]|nr:phenylpyruvate tautomerase MIF-related protein [Alphaproteobacteria bacterium]
MPFLMIKTNLPLEKTVCNALMNYASKVVAETVEKPEAYVMVNVVENQHLIFGAKVTPCVYMEMKSVGLPQSKIPELSATLTKMIEDKLHVPSNRIYIEFSSVPGNMWGFNGSTF